VTLPWPLQPWTAHLPGLQQAGQDERVWTSITMDGRDAGAMHHHVTGLITDRARGAALPFVVRRLASGEVVGCTRLKGLNDPHCSALVGPWCVPAV
jgi:hypothetical protein